jgi:ribosomal-protein-alanine N-acetyltransferase
MYRTERLLLREWNSSDIEPFSLMCADPDVMRYFPSVMTYDECVSFVDRVVQFHYEKGFGLWAIEVDGTFAGYTGLWSPAFDAPFTPCIEVGWRLASWAWGKGYATEAAKESLRIGFEEHQISEIFSFTTQSNTPSEAVMKRIGMQRREDLDFDHPNTPGWWGQSHIVYSIGQATWAEYGG